jgi:replicative DNA helicase
MAFKTALKNKKQVLILDTEMCTVDIQFRMMASISGVDVWHLESGNWRKNADMVEKVRGAIKKSKDLVYYHYHVGNKNIDQICSLVRRWYLSKVKRGDDCIIAYDYIKLTGEKIGNNWAEYQAIGEKIDKLKRLGEEINAVVITAMQLNRQGENQNRRTGTFTDDSSAIALSDRLQWFASFVAIFRRKTVDEIAMDGNGEDGGPYGTHKLIPLKTRFQGKDAAGHQDVILRMHPDGTERYAMNFLNFDVSNFNVEERGSLRDIDERMRSEIEDSNLFDGETL